MTEAEALDLVRRLLKAANDAEVSELVRRNMPQVDGVFFTTAESAARQLEREGKPGVAEALRGLTGQILRMKTLI